METTQNYYESRVKLHEYFTKSIRSSINYQDKIILRIFLDTMPVMLLLLSIIHAPSVFFADEKNPSEMFLAGIASVLSIGLIALITVPEVNRMKNESQKSVSQMEEIERIINGISSMVGAPHDRFHSSCEAKKHYEEFEINWGKRPSKKYYTTNIIIILAICATLSTLFTYLFFPASSDGNAMWFLVVEIAIVAVVYPVHAKNTREILKEMDDCGDRAAYHLAEFGLKQ